MLKDLTKGNITPPTFTKWVTKLTNKLFNKENNGGKEQRLSRQQMSVLKSMQEDKYTIVKGFRRCGLTTMLILNSIYKMLYDSTENEYRVLFILDRFRSANYEKELFIEVLNACDEYIVMVENNSFQISLLYCNRKIEVCFISQDDLANARGKHEDINLINIDNAAFIENRKTSDSIAMLVKETNARTSIASIPKGVNDLFYETWRDSLAGTAPFKMHSMKWYLDDRFNENLKGSSGLATYNIDNVGMMFEALERGDFITNDWYEKQVAMLGMDSINSVDGDFA